MNVSKIMMVLFSSIIISQIHSMEQLDQKQHWLTDIERQLISRELQVRGKEWVINEINRSKPCPEPKYDEERDLFYVKDPSDLTIKFSVSHSEASKDPIINNIFQRVQEIEKERGYCPRNSWARKENRPLQLLPATNFLGKYTRYRWAGNPQNGILHIKADFYDVKDQLLKVVLEDN